MRNIAYIILSALLMIVGSLLAYDGFFIVQRSIELIGRYMWVGIGILAYLFAYRLFQKNKDWLETFSHELTHAIVALVCLREIISFQVNKRDGVIWSSGGKRSEILVSLAPYCLPIFTYTFLFIWSLVANQKLIETGQLWGIDLIIGLSVTFHFFCFKNQTKNCQTDINKYPLYFSYIYIWFFRLFNFIVLLLCYLPWRDTGQPMKLWGAFWYLATNMWNTIKSFL